MPSKIVTLKKRKAVKVKSRPVAAAPDREVALDSSDSMPVALNSATIRDPVRQVPLHPDSVSATPEETPPRQAGVPSFKFYCYRCGQKLRVPIAWANMSLPCGRCQHDLVIPPPLAGVDL